MNGIALPYYKRSAWATDKASRIVYCDRVVSFTLRLPYRLLPRLSTNSNSRDSSEFYSDLRPCVPQQLAGSLAPAAHARVRYQFSTRAIYSGQSSNGTSFSSSISILPCQYHCASVHTHISLFSYRCCIIVSLHKIFLVPNYNILEKLCVHHVNIKFLTACFITAFNCFFFFFFFSPEETTRGMLQARTSSQFLRPATSAGYDIIRVYIPVLLTVDTLYAIN